MKLWQFLRQRMLGHRDLIAFGCGNITYGDLVELVEYPKHTGGGALEIIGDSSRQGMAVKLLRCIAKGNVAIPVDAQYGETCIRNIREMIETDGDKYPDLAFIVFTSGTTGAPKGVMLSDEAVIENIKGIDGYFSVKEGQKILIVRSLVHISALTGELLFGLYKGLQIDFYEETFAPQKIYRTLKKQTTEILCCTPTVLYHLCNYLHDTSLTDVVISGERISLSLIGKLRGFGKIRFYNVYGLTENAPRVSVLLPHEFFSCPASVGKPIRNTLIRIENGELLVRSQSCMKGYYKRSDLTEKKLRGGWLYTGDLAEIDDQGYCYILGRKDGMIIRGGVNVFPEDIEEEARRIAGITDCIVYGEDHERFGQKICLDYTGECKIIDVRKQLARVLPCGLMPDRICRIEEIAKTLSGKKKRF